MIDLRNRISKMSLPNMPESSESAKIRYANAYLCAVNQQNPKLLPFLCKNQGMGIMLTQMLPLMTSSLRTMIFTALAENKKPW
jgi:hypothetical protein